MLHLLMITSTMPTKKNIVTVTDLRRRTIGLLKDVEKGSVKYVFQRSDPKAVLMSMKMYEEMMDLQEDLEIANSKHLKERIARSRVGKMYSMDEVKKMLEIK